ncbi:hypothetical protein B0T25DRAFT_315629 [Lasiosphaeria hispida]|uniref:Uncharacterized protein n=1 Tax=Lasiosphaeria hispida TaxID=260671 RepID=A0AAJ0H970_9PEZI|nr:hypothetical protein B0T25DRAFT_315629 [Lasiosphaeria hispida]
MHRQPNCSVRPSRHREGLGGPESLIGSISWISVRAVTHRSAVLVGRKAAGVPCSLGLVNQYRQALCRPLHALDYARVHTIPHSISTLLYTSLSCPAPPSCGTLLRCSSGDPFSRATRPRAPGGRGPSRAALGPDLQSVMLGCARSWQERRGIRSLVATSRISLPEYAPGACVVEPVITSGAQPRQDISRSRREVLWLGNRFRDSARYPCFPLAAL